jgi:nucleotide-binding universal stress UspA family protein
MRQVMTFSKILFAAAVRENNPSSDIIDGILPLKKISLKELLFYRRPIDSWGKKLSDLGIATRVVAGTERALSPQVIYSTARGEGAELVVFLMGGGDLSADRLVTKKLLQGADLPVLIVRRSQKAFESKEAGWFENVIFATNWSEESEKAFRYILSMKELIKELDIVNVIHRKLTVKHMRELKVRLAETRRICLDEKIDAEGHIYAGNISEEILTAANDYKGTIIVMGAKSKKGFLKEWTAANPALDVARNATLPVLIFP